MSLTSIIIVILAIALIFLIIRLFMKTFKLVIAITVILIIIGGWLYGFSGFFDKMPDIPELGIQKIARSITSCTTEQDCAYIINPGDCRMIKEYCNNVFKEENYKKVLNEELLEEECNRTSVEIDYATDCECKLHKEREGKIKQWLGKKLEEKAGYTYCWKKE